MFIDVYRDKCLTYGRRNCADRQEGATEEIAMGKLILQSRRRSIRMRTRRVARYAGGLIIVTVSAVVPDCGIVPVPIELAMSVTTANLLADQLAQVIEDAQKQLRKRPVRKICLTLYLALRQDHRRYRYYRSLLLAYAEDLLRPHVGLIIRRCAEDHVQFRNVHTARAPTLLTGA